MPAWSPPFVTGTDGTAPGAPSITEASGGADVAPVGTRGAATATGAHQRAPERPERQEREPRGQRGGMATSPAGNRVRDHLMGALELGGLRRRVLRDGRRSQRRDVRSDTLHEWPIPTKRSTNARTLDTSGHKRPLQYDPGQYDSRQDTRAGHDHPIILAWAPYESSLLLQDTRPTVVNHPLLLPRLQLLEQLYLKRIHLQ
jgi:hypothetical protein